MLINRGKKYVKMNKTRNIIDSINSKSRKLQDKKIQTQKIAFFLFKMQIV